VVRALVPGNEPPPGRGNRATSRATKTPVAVWRFRRPLPCWELGPFQARCIGHPYTLVSLFTARNMRYYLHHKCSTVITMCTLSLGIGPIYIVVRLVPAICALLLLYLVFSPGGRRPRDTDLSGSSPLPFHSSPPAPRPREGREPAHGALGTVNAGESRHEQPVAPDNSDRGGIGRSLQSNRHRNLQGDGRDQEGDLRRQKLA
jgi:hypothetical protein